MTKSTGAPPQGHGLDGFYAALRKPGIMRRSDGRWFAGVAAGTARWLGVDPLVVRAGFILFSLFFGMGLALYLVLWLLMPDEGGEIHIERALKHGEGSSIFLLVVTAIAVSGGGPWWGGDSRGFRFFGFALLVVGAWWFLTRTGTGRELMAQAPWRDRSGSPSPSEGAAGTTSTTSGGWTPPAGDGTATPGGAGAYGSGPYGSTGNAAANAGASLGTARTPAPTVVRERTPSLGFAGSLLALGLAIVTGVALMSVAQAADWRGNALAVGVAAGVGVLGLVILVAGIAGRRSGGLHFFVVTGLFVAAVATAAPAGLTQPWQAGERSFTVTSLTPAPDFELGLGQMKVDLTNAGYAATPQTDTVTATVGVGQLDLVVPEGVRVTVHAKGRAGDLDAKGTTDGDIAVSSGDGGRTGMGGMRESGMGWERTLTYGPQTGPEQIVVDAEVGIGQINVTTTKASS
ncbi:hypothetical protein GCM10023258_12100 [Terrabacter aeriphilus]|uniref:Phage shock protein PspC N-terminal domain-containing protein n=1 Tax=Terrabacter aeriphilus TaxID=515662 RepID=A0ABP9J6E0_9MICO